MKPGRVRILNIAVDDVTMDEAVARLMELATSGSFHHVVTVNPEFIMTARQDAAFAAVLNAADLAVPDGIGLIWASRLRGRPLRERVAGVDLVERTAAGAAQLGLRLYLLGARPGVADEAAARLIERYPGLTIAGAYAGSPLPVEEDTIIARIQQASPHILFVAYGAPQQDLWIHRNRQRLGVGVAMGVGGAFDFISGRSRRAPRSVQRLGLEWLYRLYHEPWRWRRMLALPRFAWAVLREPAERG